MLHAKQGEWNNRKCHDIALQYKLKSLRQFQQMCELDCIADDIASVSLCWWPRTDPSPDHDFATYFQMFWQVFIVCLANTCRYLLDDWEMRMCPQEAWLFLLLCMVSRIARTLTEYAAATTVRAKTSQTRATCSRYPPTSLRAKADHHCPKRLHVHAFLNQALKQSNATVHWSCWT